MQFIKKFFCVNDFFKDDSVISLSSLRKRNEYVKITIPDNYKKTYIPNIETNYLLF